MVVIGIVITRDAVLIVILEGRVGISTARVECICAASCIDPVPQGIGRERGDRRVSSGRCRRDWAVLRTGGSPGIARGGVVRGRVARCEMAGTGVGGEGRHWVGWFRAGTRARP